MNRSLSVMLGSLVVVAVLLMLLVRGDSSRESGISHGDEPALMLFCAASNRAVLEAIRADYERECGTSVQIQYGPSQTLLTSMEVSQAGDLYLPADESYIQLGHDKRLLAEVLPVAEMQAVIVVSRDNPKKVHSFADLLRDDVRVVQANPDAAAIGSLTRRLLTRAGLWDDLDAATAAYRTTVTDVANDILVGAADAGIVYDAVLHTYPDLEFIEIVELEPAHSQIAMAVIEASKQPKAALHFARYVAARDRGLKHYREHGFRTRGGDVWAVVPKLSLFAGSMLRPAIEHTIAAFEDREGVEVTRVYNGCGILVAQMKAGQHPDAYFACDTEFMAQVPELFPESINVSQNELVILVEKGNPKGIRSLQDLTRSGLRVGIGHEKQCAMGWLTQNVFRQGGLQQEVMANVTVQTPTGDMLVNQMRAGSLDAAVAYLSNAAGAGEILDAIRIQGIPCSVATQPFAIATGSLHRQTAGRLFEQLCSAESRKAFRAEGFRWQMESASDGEHVP